MSPPTRGLPRPPPAPGIHYLGMPFIYFTTLTTVLNLPDSCLSPAWEYKLHGAGTMSCFLLYALCLPQKKHTGGISKCALHALDGWLCRSETKGKQLQPQGSHFLPPRPLAASSITCFSEFPSPGPGGGSHFLLGPFLSATEDLCISITRSPSVSSRTIQCGVLSLQMWSPNPAKSYHHASERGGVRLELKCANEPGLLAEAGMG